MLSIAVFKIQKNSFIEEILHDYNNLLIIIVPCSYLYFENLIKDCKTIYFKNLIHLIIPTGFNIIDYLFDNQYLKIEHVNYYYYIFFTLYTLFYYILIYKILYKNVWNRKGEIEVVIKQNQLIKKWTIYLFSFLIIVGARVILILFWEINNDNYAYATSYQWIPSVFWLILFFKIIVSPEILYGYNYLNAKINEHKKMNNATIAFWSKSPISQINNVQDNQLNEKIKNTIFQYMQEVDQFSFHNQSYRDAKFSLSDLANKLNIPKSHLSFLFKYHSKISFPEYKKIVRIYDGLELINAGYLTTNTYESLAKEIGFTSYNTFFISFKDVTGVSPQEFLIRLLRQKRFN
jgi:AraC-like DNA-binding protein